MVACSTTSSTPRRRASTSKLTRSAWLLYPEALRDDVRVATVFKTLATHLVKQGATFG